MSRAFSRRELLLFAAASLALRGDTTAEDDLAEYCFTIRPHCTLRAAALTTTPEAFLRDHPDALAAINGPYYGLHDRRYQTEGLVYYRGNRNDGLHIERSTQRIDGYFIVNGNGDKVSVQRERPKDLHDEWLTLGTFPLLAAHGLTLPQRPSPTAYRAAIGTKDETDICFAVSRQPVTMSDWAHLLHDHHYQGAINLDGGPVASLATRTAHGITLGGGNEHTAPQPTALILYAARQ